ncbi:MAG: SDR family oxidoreductase [Gammaproteobacteria bacterium]|nr:SDR family oxidoreductase [Gammaproteobacteria bacterium]
MTARVLVTGATGLVGRATAEQLLSGMRTVRIAVRNSDAKLNGAEVFSVGEIGPMTDWTVALQDVDCVIHCAARAHVFQEDPRDSSAAYREVNVEGTRRLAEQASECGVRRLIFVSSVKVNGERTEPGRRFTFATPARPEDAYGQSKWEAEQALQSIVARTGLEVVIVRPPLVYGPHARGNFARLAGLVKQGIPLPLGAVSNRRSLVALDNLVDLLVKCIDHPAAPGHTFLVSDGEDISTKDLVRRQARAMGLPIRLVPVPVILLKVAGHLSGKSKEVQRLVGSLQVDIRHTQETLGWTPPVSVDEGLRRAVNSVNR